MANEFVKTVFITEGRSGSILLMKSLAKAHTLSIFEEPFNGNGEEARLRQWKAQSNKKLENWFQSSHVNSWVRSEQVLDKPGMNIIYAIRHKKFHKGLKLIKEGILCDYVNYLVNSKRADIFKIHYSHAPISYQKFWNILLSKPVKWIHMKRRDMLRSFISRKVAMISDVWEIYEKDTLGIIINPTFIIQPSELLEYFLYTEENELFFDILLKNSKKLMLELYYEDIIQNWDSEGKRIQQFLELPEKKLEMVTSKRTSVDHLSLVENYEDLRTFFKDTKWEHMFVDVKKEIPFL